MKRLALALALSLVLSGSVAAEPVGLWSTAFHFRAAEAGGTPKDFGNISINAQAVVLPQRLKDAGWACGVTSADPSDTKTTTRRLICTKAWKDGKTVSFFATSACYKRQHDIEEQRLTIGENDGPVFTMMLGCLTQPFEPARSNLPTQSI